MVRLEPAEGGARPFASEHFGELPSREAYVLIFSLALQLFQHAYSGVVEWLVFWLRSMRGRTDAHAVVYAMNAHTLYV
jgi:hypothetical protein